MVGVSVRHNTQWMGPTPLWAKQSTAGLQVAGNLAAIPQVLRFANDSFMEEFLEVINTQPRKLSEYVLQQKETWRKPMTPPEKTAYPENETAISKLLTRTRSKTDLLKVPDKVVINTETPTHPPAITEQQPELLKLYQPGHQRHYLITAALVKNEFGLPDKKLEITNKEKVSFVVRRLMPPDDANDPHHKKLSEDTLPDSSWSEHAFIKTPRGNVWKKIGQYARDTSHLMSAEEELPMFPSSFAGDCCDRVLYSGTIPVARREQWMTAPEESGEPSLAQQQTQGNIDSLAKAIFVMDVAEPWRALMNKAAFASGSMNRSFDEFPEEDGAGDLDRLRQCNSLRDQIQTGSWYILLDFSDFLEQHLPEIWAVIAGDATRESLESKAREFYDLLHATTFNSVLRSKIARSPISGYRSRLSEALLAIRAFREKLESVEIPLLRRSESDSVTTEIFNNATQNWPDFIFPFADPEHPTTVPPINGAVSVYAPIDEERDKQKLQALVDLLGELLPKDTENYASDIPLQTSLMDNNRGWFVIRCVYQRPNCGPLFPALVSRPTWVLQMAPFFDPDAPARPIRIPMPMDISPAGLRKYSKNTGFILSDMLCGGVKKMRSYTLGDLVLSVLPWPFHKDLPDPGKTGPCKENGLEFGMICSLSIPIVTLCAFILLIIMVALFDLFFRWIPWLMICLPIPGLKGKN
ncbi:hypothetical protein SAMN02745866_01760 [Alteromonadaceae bacterium Bs31]|nr:hypothetical protein SAMN02745866_01760 [Alteromonadaceae bacterium Bs31]